MKEESKKLQDTVRKLEDTVRKLEERLLKLEQAGGSQQAAREATAVNKAMEASEASIRAGEKE
ncbi:MAG: hypothetical protein ACLQU3_15630 [Limisphaerales bacterium]